MEIEPTLYEFIKEAALRNALEHNGKTNVNIVISHLIAKKPDLKNSITDIMITVKGVVDEVNSLSRGSQEVSVQKFAQSYTGSKVAERRENILPELPYATTGNVVTRFPPEPNGFPHIGHAKAAIIDEEYAKMYDGKMILRFDDTNPMNEKIEYYEAIQKGLEWLEVKVDKVKNTSDDIALLHDYGKKLVFEGHAYVCTCSANTIHRNRTDQLECPCRLDHDNTIGRLDRMFDGDYAQNEAVIRFKGDMRSLNTAMRDPTLFRIIDYPHPLLGSKIRIWPTYDMAAPIEDSLDGVSHALRTKEYELRNELYYSILRKLDMKSPTVIEFSRLEFDGMPVSKRKIKPLLDQGIISSWDDPRLPTLWALRRRGYTPEAIRKFVLSLGITLAETKPPFEVLESINRKIIDPISPRVFFVSSPVELIVKGGKQGIVELRNHPNEKLGKRLIQVTDRFYVALSDANDLRVGDVLRLMELFNIRIEEIIQEGNKKVIISSYYDDQIIQSMKKIQWVSKSDAAELSVTIPKNLFIEDSFNPNSLIIVNGYVESYILKIKIGTVLQFVRFGFCKLNSYASATYAHR